MSAEAAIGWALILACVAWLAWSHITHTLRRRRTLRPNPWAVDARTGRHVRLIHRDDAA